MRQTGPRLMAAVATFATLTACLAIADYASAATVRRTVAVSRPVSRPAVHVNTVRRAAPNRTVRVNTARTVHTVRRTTTVSHVVPHRTSGTRATTRHTVSHTNPVTNPVRPTTHPAHTTIQSTTVKPHGHSAASHAAAGGAGAALLHAHSHGTKPAHVQHNPRHTVGKLGNQFNHKPVIFARHGHFFHRHYYSMLVGGALSWFWYDDPIYDYDPVIATLASVPVCGTDNTDDCDVEPLATVRPADYRPPPAPALGTCDLEVFGDPGFAGERLHVKEDMPYVGDSWNDHVSSIQIRSGTWQFYQDPEYGGDMIRMAPGQYPQLDDKWTGQISSFRCMP
ncbi:MAG: beta/gamma crystallin-related protein [Xanthobacteraceae bacterium]